MKVLHLNSNYNTSIIYKNLFKELEKIGIQQYIYIPVVKGKKIFKKELNVEEDTNYIKHKYRECFSNLEEKLFFPKVYSMLKELKKCFEIDKIDIIHAHSTFSNGFLAYILKKMYKKKYIVAFRSTDYEVYNNFKVFHWLIKKILKEAEKIIFINYVYKKNIIDNKYIQFESKSLVIPNGIEEFWLRRDKTKKKIDNKINFITVGYFIKRKNFLYTIDLYNKLNIKNKGKLYIIGEGPLEKEIKNKAKDNKNIEIYSWQSKENLKEFYLKSNVFILPSENETFGLVYIEALSQGLDIIYRKNDGIDGYIKEENGVACDMNIEEDMRRIEKFLLIKNQKNESNIDRFRWSNIAEIYYKIYLEIIK